MKKKSKKVSNVFHHLDKQNQQILYEAIFPGGPISAWKLEDLSAAGVSYQHFFDLEDNNPVSILVQRMPAKHNEKVQTKIENMLKAMVVKMA